MSFVTIALDKVNPETRSSSSANAPLLKNLILDRSDISEDVANPSIRRWRQISRIFRESRFSIDATIQEHVQLFNLPAIEASALGYNLLENLERIWLLHKESTHYIEGEVKFLHAQNVYLFLETHPKITLIMPTAIEKIRGIFGRETSIEMDVFSDPEVANVTILNVSIATKKSPEESHSLLDQFDYGWLLNQSSDVIDYVNFIPN